MKLEWFDEGTVQSFCIELSGVGIVHSFPEYKKEINGVMGIEEFYCRREVADFEKYDLVKCLGRHIHIFLPWWGSDNPGTSPLRKNDFFRLGLDNSVQDEDKHRICKEQNGTISKINFSPSDTGSISDQVPSFYGASSDEKKYQVDLYLRVFGLYPPSGTAPNFVNSVFSQKMLIAKKAILSKYNWCKDNPGTWMKIDEPHSSALFSLPSTYFLPENVPFRDYGGCCMCTALNDKINLLPCPEFAKACWEN